MVFDQFLCTPLLGMSDTTKADTFVRRDVTREPGGVGAVFRNKCQGCHAGMDSLGGAFSYFEYIEGNNGTGRIYHSSQDQNSNVNNADGQPLFDANGVANKMNRAGDVFPTGRVTADNYWKNVWTDNKAIGWRGNVFEGYGPKSMGQMMANTKAFSSCMAMRTFQTVCGREMAPSERDILVGYG